MALSKAEQASLEALDNGATFEEALALLPKPTPEFLATLNRYGDPIAEYGDWTDEGELIPPEEAMRRLAEKQKAR